MRGDSFITQYAKKQIQPGDKTPETPTFKIRPGFSTKASKPPFDQAALFF